MARLYRTQRESAAFVQYTNEYTNSTGNIELFFLIALTVAQDNSMQCTNVISLNDEDM